MSKNFDGLGLGFEGFDDGASKTVDKISDSIGDLWSGIQKVGSGIPRAVGGIGRGLSKMGYKGSQAMGLVTTAIGGMVDKAMSPDIDNAYSSMFAGYNKSFAQMTAGMKDNEGRLDKARKKIGGIAMGMGEDMTQLAQSYIPFEQQGVKLENILGTKGLTNTIRALAKVTSVYEANGKELSNVFSGLIGSFGFTEKRVGSLADKMVAVGTEFNMGKEVIQEWPAIFEALNKELADFGVKTTPEQMDNLTMSIVKLGAGFKESMKMDPKAALELAKETFTTLAGERQNILDMYRGKGGEFGEVAKQMMETGGDVTKMFNVMASGDPLKFMDTIRRMSADAEKQGGVTGAAFQRLSGTINKALGPDVTFAMKGSWDGVAKKMAGLPDIIAKSSGAFVKGAEKGWKSSLTAGEGWDMFVNTMKAKVFGLTSKDMHNWVGNMKAGMNETYDVVSSMAEDKGPLGELTKKFLMVQRVGLSALLPALGGLGPIFAGITTDMLPMLTALGSMGLRFSDFGKLAIGGGGLFLAFKILTDGPDKVIEQFQNMGNSLSKILTSKVFTKKKYPRINSWINEVTADVHNLGLVDTVKKQVANIPWDYIWGELGKLGNVTSGLLLSLGDLLGKIPWGDLAYKAVVLIGKAFKAVGGGIWSAVFGDDDTKYVEGSMGDIFSKAGKGAVRILKDVVKGALKGLWDSIFEPDSLSDSFRNLGKIMTAGFAGLFLISSGFRNKIMGMGWKGIKSGAGYVGKKAYNYIRGGVGYIGSTAGVSPQVGSDGYTGGYQGGMLPANIGPSRMLLGKVSKKGIMGRIGGGIKGGLGKVGRGVKSFGRGLNIGPIGGMMAIGGVIEGITQLSERTENIHKISLSKMLTDEEKFLLKSQEGFKGVTNAIDGMFMGLPGIIGKALGISEDDLTSFYNYMVASGQTAIFATVETFKFMGRAAGKSWDWIGASADLVLLNIKKGMVVVKNTVLDIFNGLLEKIDNMIFEVANKIMYPFDFLSFKMKGWFSDFIDGIFGKEGDNSVISIIAKKLGIGEDLIKSSRAMSSAMKKENAKYLGGYSTFYEAREAKTNSERKAREDIYGARKKADALDHENEMDAIQKEEDRLNKIRKANGLGAIGRDWSATKQDIGTMSDINNEKAVSNSNSNAARKLNDELNKKLIPSAESMAAIDAVNSNGEAIKENTKAMGRVVEELAKNPQRPIIVHHVTKLDGKVIEKSMNNIQAGRAIGATGR